MKNNPITNNYYIIGSGAVKTYHKLFNPLTPGPFCKKCIFWTFWWFLGWILSKLALIWLKMHLQHDSLPFLLLASRFKTFRLRHAQKSKFCGLLLLYNNSEDVRVFCLALPAQ